MFGRVIGAVSDLGARARRGQGGQGRGAGVGNAPGELAVGCARRACSEERRGSQNGPLQGPHAGTGDGHGDNEAAGRRCADRRGNQGRGTRLESQAGKLCANISVFS